MKRFLILAALLLGAPLLGNTPATAQTISTDQIAKIIASTDRSAADRARR